LPTNRKFPVNGYPYPRDWIFARSGFIRPIHHLVKVPTKAWSAVLPAQSRRAFANPTSIDDFTLRRYSRVIVRIPPKTVLRAGFGLFFDRISTTLNALRNKGATQQSYLILNPTFLPSIPSPETLESGRQPQQIERISDGIKAGRTYQSRRRNRAANYAGDVYPFGDKNIRLQTESAGIMRLSIRKP